MVTEGPIALAVLPRSLLQRSLRQTTIQSKPQVVNGPSELHPSHSSFLYTRNLRPKSARIYRRYQPVCIARSTAYDAVLLAALHSTPCIGPPASGTQVLEMRLTQGTGA